MKTELFDFQLDALEKLRGKVKQARTAASSANPQAIAFSAPTGAGKTIVMTALFEQLLFGEHDLDAQPDAAILWVSDMPELNEQTRLKIEAMSSRIRTHQLVTIDAGFDAEQLEGGRIYFVNTQKLGTDKLLTRPGDTREFSIWKTFTNTARAMPERFYVVIDEAHRGMTRGNRARDAQSIMQRFILGSDRDGLCSMPMVLGVSATPRRFQDLLADSTDHTTHNVHVSPEEVRASGLLKDRILIHYPESETRAEMALLAEAAREWQTLESSWKVYCKAEGENPPVYPVLVVQVEDGADQRLTRTDLPAALATIEDTIDRPLREGEIAHTFNDHGDIDINGHKLRHENASRIQETRNVSVVFFKMSLSTGWDCPRAEVMMSFRRAEDHTYIAQLLGRMVRSPLARRVEVDAALNDVHLYLPHYNRQAVDAVIEDLKNQEEAPPTESGIGRELVTLQRSADTDAIFEAMAGLVTYRVDAVRKQSALRRFIKLGRRLTQNSIADDAQREVKQEAMEWFKTGLRNLKDRGEYESSVKRLTGVHLRTVAFSHGSRDASGIEEEDPAAIEAARADIERYFEHAGRVLGEGLHQRWWSEHADRNALDVKLELIVLAGDRQAMERVEKQAEDAFNDLYSRYQHEFGRLPEKQRSYYDRLRLAAEQPEPLDWRLPATIGVRRSNSAQSYARHLYVDNDRKFRADLGRWEDGVIAEELNRSDVVGWLRNIERKPWALQIPYEVAGDVRPMYPDFIVVRRDNDDYRFDVLEPHDGSRSDNHWKAVGLAKFADRHEHSFGRVQIIREVRGADGALYFSRLDMSELKVRDAVRGIQNNEQLDQLFEQYAD